MKARRLSLFLASALASGALCATVTARAAWLRAAPTTCEILANGAWTAKSGSSASAAVSTSSTSAMQLYCPVADSSSITLSNSGQITTATVLVYQSAQGLAYFQVCTDQQSSVGGSCDSAITHSPTGAGIRSPGGSVTNWQAVGNTDQLHYLFVNVPSNAAGSAQFLGYTVYN
jgi:hypothetical protein